MTNCGFGGGCINDTVIHLATSEMGHCILSHHGELEYGSPKKPAIAEAVALSMADNLDAKLETLRECFEAKDSNDCLGFNRCFFLRFHVCLNWMENC